MVLPPHPMEEGYGWQGCTFGIGTEGAQGAGAQTDVVFTFNCFFLAQHLELPLRSHQLVQYGAGTGENQWFSLPWQFYGWEKRHASQVWSNRFLLLYVCNNALYYTGTEMGCYKEERLRWTSWDGDFTNWKAQGINLLLQKNGNMKQANCMPGPRYYLWRILDHLHPQQMHKSQKLRHWKIANPSS